MSTADKDELKQFMTQHLVVLNQSILEMHQRLDGLDYKFDVIAEELTKDVAGINSRLNSLINFMAPTLH